jgi:adenine-specific DNA-methyltransferase
VKIGWGNLALKSQFSFIPADYIINAPSPFFVTENYYLLAVLNSTIADYYIKQLGVSRSGGYFEYKPMFVEQLPIPFIEEAEQKKFCDIVEKIIYEKANNRETSDLEYSLDQMIFDLYSLVEEEINLVSNS